MAANLDNNSSSNSSSKQPIGVYRNKRLMHACTTIVGFTVHLQTKDGSVWEGIFNTFNPEFTICLDLAIQINPKINSKDCLYTALKNGSQATEQAFFDLKDIVRITVIDVDLNYASKESNNINSNMSIKSNLATDADISGFDASKLSEHKLLESWQDDDGDNVNTDSLLSLDDVASSGNKDDSNNSGSRGWDPQEMFRYNEQVHKVTTTYDEKLTDYTVPLPKHNSTKEWRKKQERAAAIAKEIESNTKSQVRLAKEDGSDCEEEKFSAVVRPTPIARPPPPPQQSQQQQQQQQQQHQQQHQHQQHQHHQHQQQPPSTLSSNAKAQNGTHRNFRRGYERSRIDSLKNFGKQLNLGPRQPQNQGMSPMQRQQQQQHQQTPPQPQHQVQPHQHQAQPQHQAQSQSQPQPQPQPQPQQTHHSHTQHTQSQPQQTPQPQPKTTQSQPQQAQSNQVQPESQNQHASQPSQSHHQPQPQSQQQPQQQSQPHQPQTHHQQQQIQHPQTQPQMPAQQATSQPQSHQQQLQPPSQPQQKQPQQQVPLTQTQQSPAPSTINVSISSPSTVTPTSTVNTSTISERSDTSSTGNQSKVHQSELVKKSKLNPNAPEFVYKPRSPATNLGTHTNGANQASTSRATTLDPANSSPMSQAPHTPYYQSVPMFPLGLSPHQQQHHAAQFMPNHTHPHFQNQIHYMSPVPPHFAQQMSQRYIRGNFQNYHHRGEHHNNVRADYSQASMMAPTSTGQPFAHPPSGAPHPMNAYPAPQQPMIYSGPQSMYPVVQAGFPPHVSHVMPNPPPYDGSTVYMPSQNYIVNP